MHEFLLFFSEIIKKELWFPYIYFSIFLILSFMKKYILITFLLCTSIVSAQTITFALSHTENGEPVDAQYNWQISNQTLSLYIILNNNKPISAPLVYLFIDKKDRNNSYYPFDSKVIKVDGSKNWVAYNYKFIEPGTYHVYFQSADQKKIADGNVVIIRKSFDDNAFTNGQSRFYEEYQLKFCEVVIAGKPMNISNLFSLRKHGRNVFFYMKSYHALNTEKIFVNIYTKKEFDFGYEEFVDSKKYKVDPTWDDTFFKYKFFKAGDYKVMIFNDNEELMATGYLSITKRNK